jgi:hypothetical protein
MSFERQNDSVQLSHMPQTFLQGQVATSQRTGESGAINYPQTLASPSELLNKSLSPNQAADSAPSVVTTLPPLSIPAALQTLLAFQQYSGIPMTAPLTEEPLYVNAKQYYRILKRREQRAKLEQENKLPRQRKPFLHQSRHEHAMKRARSKSGRFAKKQENTSPQSQTQSQSQSQSQPPPQPQPQLQEQLQIQPPQQTKLHRIENTGESDSLLDSDSNSSSDSLNIVPNFKRNGLSGDKTQVNHLQYNFSTISQPLRFQNQNDNMYDVNNFDISLSQSQ